MAALAAVTVPGRRVAFLPADVRTAVVARPSWPSRLRAARLPVPTAAAAVVALPSVAGALPSMTTPEAPQASLDQLGSNLVNLFTKGQLDDKVYDPSTEEGARQLGLAVPVPSVDKLVPVETSDILPIAAIFVVALIWGLLVVPNIMERADGSETTYFEKKEPAKPPLTPELLAEASNPVVPPTRRIAPSADKEASERNAGKQGSAKKEAGFKK